MNAGPAALLPLALLAALPALAGWRTPPPEVAAQVERPATPRALPSPDGSAVLLLERPALPPLAELPARRRELAGVSIDLARRADAELPVYATATVIPAAGGEPRRIAGLAPQARIVFAAWAPRGGRIALTVLERDRLTLWLAVPGAPARRLATPALNAVFGPPCAWLADGRALACRLAVGDGSAAMAPQPAIRESDGAPNVVRAQRGLLASEADAALFAAAAGAQLARIGIDGRLRRLGPRGVIAAHAPSPDDRYLLVETLLPPFPFGYPHDQFARRVELLALADGRRRVVAELPFEPALAPEVDAVSAHPRGHAWRADAPATLFWAEAQDGGDPRRTAPLRDRALLWEAPFTAPPRRLGEFPMRLEALHWGHGDLALALGSDWLRRRAAYWRLRPDASGSSPQPIFDWSSEDHAADPGRPLLRAAPRGVEWLDLDGDALLFVAPGDGRGGERPELRRVEPDSGAARVIWRSGETVYEQPLARLAGGRLLLWRESPQQPPHWLSVAVDGGAAQAIGVAPAPTFAQARRLDYQRGDGLALSATLYLPATAATALPPLLLMAYPEDYLSAEAAAGASSGALHWRGAFLGGAEAFTARGYAVLAGAAMPVVARIGEAPNDSYVEQVVDNAHAALDAVARLGLADTRRAAVAGHSYGASMTATLLAHSKRFCAGLALSGAYNRTLTPFGFQTEMRNLWQTPRDYLAMSPLLAADRIEAPLLLIHGAADDNPGTAPSQSEAMYAALRGLGKRARLVLLPGEGHDYRSREGVLHALAEQIDWLDRWVAGGAGCATAAAEAAK